MRIDTSFRIEVEGRSGQNIRACYQCLKCFAGCPMSRYMDYKPNALIRMIQYGEKEKVLKSRAIWLCVSCMTCGVRCPNEVDMSVVMDTIREMSREEVLDYENEKRLVMLHEEFLRSIKMWGRLHEVTFFMAYMIKSLDFFSNMSSGITLMSKGKLPMIPKPIKGIRDIRKLFKKSFKTKKEW
jgi:heterodisulfide reductase subunit C